MAGLDVACHSDIVALNVGGTRFCTSRKTLLSTENSFFSSLVCGRYNSAKDSTGAIFIDRDPALFAVILHYLRTRKVDLRGENVRAVKDEAEFYGIMSLAKALQLVEEQDGSSCGGLFFSGFINPPTVCHDGGGEGEEVVPVQIPGVIDNPVRLITGHQNYLAVAYSHYVCVHRLMNAVGWEHVFTTPLLPQAPGQVALNVKHGSGRRRFLAAASGGTTTVWDIAPAEGESAFITTHTFNAPVDVLFFIGTQLVVMSHLGEVSVWNAVTQQWKVQKMTPITSHATVNSTMLLGCGNGSIYYIDMEKFPLRMKDNDLLVTQVYEDPGMEAVTALSVYFTKSQNLNSTTNSLEIAYGTSNGNVRVIADHPETLGRGFLLLQTFTVHRSPISRVCLTEKYLVSVCSEYNHVRTWTVTRFRGNLSTQTFPAPLASFHVLSLEMGSEAESLSFNEIGPFGYHHKEQEDHVFIQRVAPVTAELYCRLAATGQRVCELRSVDNSYISAHCVVDFDASNRSASCERSYIFTGHATGAVQMWDLTTAYEMTRADRGVAGSESDGPSNSELLRVLERFDLRSTDDAASANCSVASLSQRSLRLQLRESNSGGGGALSPVWPMASVSPLPSMRSMLSNHSMGHQSLTATSSSSSAGEPVFGPPLSTLSAHQRLLQQQQQQRERFTTAAAATAGGLPAAIDETLEHPALAPVGGGQESALFRRALPSSLPSSSSAPSSVVQASASAAGLDLAHSAGAASSSLSTAGTGGGAAPRHSAPSVYGTAAAVATGEAVHQLSPPPPRRSMTSRLISRVMSDQCVLSRAADGTEAAAAASAAAAAAVTGAAAATAAAAAAAAAPSPAPDAKALSSKRGFSHRRSKSASLIRQSFFGSVSEKVISVPTLDDVISNSGSLQTGSSVSSITEAAPP